MRNRSSALSLASALVLPLLGLPALAHAQVSAVPSALNFQGRLATPSGNPVADGTYSIRFSLHDALTAGTEKWNKTVANVQVKNGVFAVTLDTFPPETFNTNLWVEVKIGSDTALTPRTPLVSVPYAIKSDLALTVPDSSLTASKFAAGELSNAVNGLAWLLGGNSAASSHFLGTTNNQPLVVKTNNSERLRIDTAGKVGIGTNSPQQSLSVVGGINLDQGDLNAGAVDYTGTQPALRFGSSSGEAIASKRTSGGNQYGLDFFTNSLNRMSITGSGNVGIGTTTPLQTLDVNGRLNLANGVIQRGGTALTTINDLGLYSQVPNDWIRFVTNGGDFRFYSDGGTGTNPLMTLWSNGSLGIGTASPQAMLHVAGFAQVDQVLTVKRNDPNAFVAFNPQGGSDGREWWVGSTRSNSHIAKEGSFFIYDQAAAKNRLSIWSNGNVGIGLGTEAPLAKLEVRGNGLFQDGINIGGNVGIGTMAPQQKLSVVGGVVIDQANQNSGSLNQNGFEGYGLTFGAGSGEGIASTRHSGSNVNGLDLFTNHTKRLSINNSGNIGIGTSNPQTTLDVNGSIQATVIRVTGGADVAEPFDVSSQGAAPQAGMLVSIDPTRIGALRVAASAYDRNVAGIISGANGIRPGLVLSQSGTVADGHWPVASSGRVWCLCDADAAGAIEPGDLITTSATPGHGMKADDSKRSIGCIVGKAMSPLKSGRGMVLVLVSLQ